MSAAARMRQHIIKSLASLSATEHEEVFLILRRRGVPYTQNKNGVFCNLSAVPEDVLQELSRFMEYCISNQQDLDAYTRALHINRMQQRPLPSASDVGNAGSSHATRSLMTVLDQQGSTPTLQQLPVAPCRSSVAQSERAQAMASMLDGTLQSTQRKANNAFLLAKKRYTRVAASACAASDPSFALNNNTGVLVPEPYLR